MYDTTAVVVGLGYVGLPLAVLAREKGWEVIGIDIDENKVSQISNKQVPFEDNELQKQLSAHPITATTDFADIRRGAVIVIAVPTPVTSTNEPDLIPLKNALVAARPHLQPGQTVIVESTINPGVMDEVVAPILAQRKDILIAHCPERINPGDPAWSVRNIPRVLGAYSQEGAAKALKFYESILEAPVKVMQSPTEAEAVKILENTFRDVNIAFVNEMARSFDKLNIDIINVINGASTKPFGFMPHFPGNGVGGHCISVDPYYMIERGRQAGFDHKFLKLARKINENMPAYTVSRLEDAAAELGLTVSDAQVAVLGVAYKRNVADTRNSPALKILKLLGAKGWNTIAFDSHVPAKSTVDSLPDALAQADIILIGCDHDDLIRDLSVATLVQNGIQIIIDGKNALNPKTISDAGIVYRGIGR